jgi:hypothetical protein
MSHIVEIIAIHLEWIMQSLQFVLLPFDKKFIIQKTVSDNNAEANPAHSRIC